MRSIIFTSTYLLFLASSVSASPTLDLDSRAESDACKHPQAQPLIKSITNQFPKSVVNSFCTSVLGPSNVSRTTVTKVVSTTIKRVTETVTDTYTGTSTKCVFNLPKREAFPTPMPEVLEARAQPPELQCDAQGRVFGFPAKIVSETCKCVVAPVKVITKVTATETYQEYTFVATTQTQTTTTTITSALPTFVAQFKGGPAAVNNKYLQVKALNDENGNFLANSVAIVPRNLATTLSISCEGYLIQHNTTSQGVKSRLIAQSPIYFDPQGTADVLQAGSGEQPLFCSVAAGKLKCYAVDKTVNLFQYCPVYEEFFSTSFLITQSEGPDCNLLEIAVLPV